ncbi:MAG: TonB family protein [Polyangiaceae bacterium]|jgi:TonB family protein
MRTRDVTIPLGLWICAAICAHFFFGTGGLVIAKVHDDRSELWRLSREASSLAKQGEQTFEVSLGEPTDEPPGEPPPPPPIATPPPPKPPPAPTTKPEPPKHEDKPKEEKRVLLVEKRADEKKPPVHPDPIKDRRIAVVQHTKPNQDDNPTAKFIADQANRVNEETRATMTSHDRDDDRPTPAKNHPGSENQPGDSESNHLANSEDQKGEKKRAPGERGDDVDVQHEPRLPKPEPRPTMTLALAAKPAAGSPRNTADEPKPSMPQATPNEPQPAPGGAVPSSPDVETSPNGGWTFNPAQQGGADGLATRPNADTPRPTLPGGKLWTMPGLGQGAPAGSFNTNLSQGQIASVVGSDSLRKLRLADGERRRSEHRGSWSASNFERWRSAIENYVSSVKPGNQTSLNAAAVPFATYLNGMHNRIHPIFAESFLESLDGLPPSHPMNDQHLVTRLEIVLTKDGRLKRMGIVQTSGITAFDIAALDAVDRAQPFGPAPSAIVSPDGNVYLHWEFHRDEVFACSTMGASPFILNVPAPASEPAPQLPTTPAPGPSKERGAPPPSPNDAREGLILHPPPPPSTQQSKT